MTSATVSRLIKEELLSSAYPEIYEPRNIKRVAPKSIRKIKTPKEEIKIEIKPKRKRENSINVDSAYNDEVEFVRSFAPRRPYQWKGRKVKKILRPGTVVSFTPGQRSGTAIKRTYDEVYADEDILQQAAEGTGEFAYGKKRKLGDDAIILDENNRTPSLVPVTPQIPVRPMAGKKRPIELQPTVQMLIPSKRARLLKPESNSSVVPMALDLPDVGPSSLFQLPKVETETKMEIDDIKVRPIKKVTSEIGVQTVDVTTSASSKKMWGPASKKLPQGVRYHPSIILGPKVVNRRRRRRKQNRKRRRSSAIGILPQVTYHPTINAL